MEYVLKYKGKPLSNGKRFDSYEKAEYEQGLIIINYGYKPDIVPVKDSGYTKRLEIGCDDEMFRQGKIEIYWNQRDQNPGEILRVCRLRLNLQGGNTAILRVEEIDNLIEALKTVKVRLS